MSFDPFFNAPLIIQIHIAFAIPALVVGPVALFRTRRDMLHRAAGYTWVLAIIGTSVSGLMIPSNIAVIGHFGPIHIFSIFALWGVAEGMYHIARRNIAKHQASMQSVWFGAMGLAGLFTLLPGRRMNQMIFGDRMDLGWYALGVGLVALTILWRWHLARSPQMPLGKAGTLD